MYFAIWHKIEESSQTEYLKYYLDLSIVITKSLIYSSVIALSRIYDTHKDSAANIYSLLNSIDSDKSFIDSEKLAEIKKFAKEQEEVLKNDEFATLKNNLKAWRDKFHAHSDKDFFNNEEALREKYPISIKDFEQLLNFARNTAKHIYVLINGADILNSPKTKCEKELNLLFDILGQHKQMHDELCKIAKGQK